ncbi:MAG: 3-phosphoglycerate dehydrogenase, partial [Clostridia bacterium]|nr:3-phosphoglycerate dehydrogenase [Clostridia bacterium]
MKIVFVGDAYITTEMMEAAAAKRLAPDDKAEFFFFGEQNRGDMRDTVKMIEAHRREEIAVPDGLFEAVADADILVVHLCPVNADLIEAAPKLRAVLSCRGGTENIDLETTAKKGIIVSSNPAHNANAVAEYTIGLMLCETRNIARADAALKAGTWREKYPNTATTIREISDMTVGIIGFGSVGRLVAEKLGSFNCRVLVYDPYIDESAFDILNQEFVGMDELLEQSDIITMHARASTYLLDFEQFAKMKPTAYVINTARSVMINPEALKDALDTGKIMGAAIDVFESEPAIPDFYRHYDNITITNHRGGDTINSYSDSPVFALDNYFGYLKGKKLRFWMNREQM